MVNLSQSDYSYLWLLQYMTLPASKVLSLDHSPLPPPRLPSDKMDNFPLALQLTGTHKLTALTAEFRTFHSVFLERYLRKVFLADWCIQLMSGPHSIHVDTYICTTFYLRGYLRGNSRGASPSPLYVARYLCSSRPSNAKCSGSAGCVSCAGLQAEGTAAEDPVWSDHRGPFLFFQCSGQH
jgi:hypothetical protein